MWSPCKATRSGSLGLSDGTPGGEHGGVWPGSEMRFSRWTAREFAAVAGRELICSCWAGIGVLGVRAITGSQQGWGLRAGDWRALKGPAEGAREAGGARGHPGPVGGQPREVYGKATARLRRGPRGPSSRTPSHHTIQGTPLQSPGLSWPRCRGAGGIMGHCRAGCAWRM